jgi:hypothetical protein
VVDDAPIIAVLQGSAVCFFPTTQAILGAKVCSFVLPALSTFLVAF